MRRARMALFDIEKYRLKPPKRAKRSRSKPKVDKAENPYNRLSKIYERLTELIPSELFTEKEFIEWNGLRLWYNKYSSDYEYNGINFKGQLYMGYECEIVGTENWDIIDRLKIHQELLNNYHKCMNADKAMILIKKRWNI